MEFATIAAAQRLAFRALVKLTAFCCHRGRAQPHSWCTADAPRSPAPSMPVRKYYSVRRRHFPLDVPAQYCGVSLSTLTQEDRQMATPGQPTSYKPEYIELAHNYCLLGATNEVLAGFFGAKACPERSRRDLMPVASGDEILRFAQDDNGKSAHDADPLVVKVGRHTPQHCSVLSRAQCHRRAE